MVEENSPHRPQITVQAPSTPDVVTGSLPAASEDFLSHESSNSINNGTSQSEAPSSGNVSLSPASSPSPSPGSAVLGSPNENELSEAELRRLYDDEEIERFLGLFSDYVSEVVLPAPRQGPASKSKETLGQHSSTKSSTVDLTEVATPSASTSVVDIELPDVLKTCQSPGLLGSSLSRNPEQSISETIAFTYILPRLPPARPRPERFTIGRLRIAAQRLFLVTQAAYASFFRHLITLATWKDKKKSLMYCSLFWTLWYHDKLLPALFSRILFALLRRKILPYPTLQELRERRQEVAKAEELGDQLQNRLSTPSSGIMEAWRLFRVVAKSNKQKMKHQKEKLKGKESESIKSDSVVSLPRPNEDTVLDEPNESQEDKDIKREVLHLLSDFADFHERVRNIFLWRKPQSTVVYLAILTFLVFFTAWLPTKYIVKLAVFILGFLFWHVVPVIATLPPADRERLPPMFENSPTDAEYAMELISQRIARGEKIRPVAKRKPKNQKKHKNANKKSKLSVPADVDGEHSQVSSDAEDAEDTSGERSASPEAETQSPPREIDWSKWGQKAASVKAWVDRKQESVNVTRQPKEAQNLTAAETGAHTFLAYQKASPGLLVLTSSMLLYTPVTSPRPKLEVALTSMRGVKKTGIGIAVPGLSVKWERTKDAQGATGTDANAGTEIVEEKFQWVGGRDELFARLVAWEGRKWLQAVYTLQIINNSEN